MTKRPYNFSAGPAALPETVLQQVAAEMLAAADEKITGACHLPIVLHWGPLRVLVRGLQR